MLLATADTIGNRLMMSAMCCVGGIFLVLMGISNIKNKQAEETGGRRLTNKVLGRSNTYEGSTAVAYGWLRVVCGIALFIFGIVFFFIGPILAD